MDTTANLPMDSAPPAVSADLVSSPNDDISSLESMTFPEKFAWGSATAAYQIEGKWFFFKKEKNNFFYLAFSFIFDFQLQ